MRNSEGVCAKTGLLASRMLASGLLVLILSACDQPTANWALVNVGIDAEGVRKISGIRSFHETDAQCAWDLYSSDGELREPTLTCVDIRELAPVFDIQKHNAMPDGYIPQSERDGGLLQSQPPLIPIREHG